jgi:hypothetical protein
MGSVNCVDRFAESYFCSWEHETCTDVVLLVLKALSFLTVAPVLGIGLAYTISQLSKRICPIDASSSETSEKTDQKAQEILKTKTEQPEEKITIKLPDWLAKQEIPVRRHEGAQTWEKTKLAMDAPICWVKSDNREILGLKLEAVYLPGLSFKPLPPSDSGLPDSCTDVLPFLACAFPPESGGTHWSPSTECNYFNHRGGYSNDGAILFGFGGSLVEEVDTKLADIEREEDLPDPKLKFSWLLVRLLGGEPVQVKEYKSDGHWKVSVAN